MENKILESAYYGIFQRCTANDSTDSLLIAFSRHCKSLLNYLTCSKTLLSPTDADTFYTMFKLLFFCIHSRAPDSSSSNNWSPVTMFEAYHDIHDCLMFVSGFLYGPACCGLEEICRSTHCLRSQICIIARSLLPVFIEETEIFRQIPDSLQGIKESYATCSFCLLCEEEDKPTDDFLIVLECKQIFCKSCYRKWLVECGESPCIETSSLCRNPEGNFLDAEGLKKFLALDKEFRPKVERLTANRNDSPIERYRLYTAETLDSVKCLSITNWVFKHLLEINFFPNAKP